MRTDILQNNSSLKKLQSQGQLQVFNLGFHVIMRARVWEHSPQAGKSADEP